MFGNKRLAKRSIIGTRVSALWSQDGRYYPAMIQAQVAEETITSGAVYAVRFDEGGTQHVRFRNVIGSGFQTITAVNLIRGQRVFLTLNGREVCGVVAQHDRDHDEVLVNLMTPSGDEFTAARRLEDVRLMESRKSARLESQPNTDYSKMADLQFGDNKRRAASHVIDVPSASIEHFGRHRHESGEFTDSENGDNIDVMDATSAAMVLTALSVSPTSPTIPAHFRDQDTHLCSSVASSGFYSGPSERDDHSPPLAPLSESAPAYMGYPSYPGPPSPGDDSSGSSGRLQICEEQTAGISFRCTWRGCKHTGCTSDSMERHIRRVHFDRDSDIELTDNEEEFHYTEVDNTSKSISTMTRHFAAMNTSSPKESVTLPYAQSQRHVSADNVSDVTAIKAPVRTAKELYSERGVFDHDYQMKVHKITSSTISVLSPPQETLTPRPLASSLPVAMPQGQIQKSLSWQMSPSPGTLPSPSSRPTKLSAAERLFQHQAQSPKSSVPQSQVKVSQLRRSRSEVRKCRKVYGMEHRDQWCTQCKWKKACTRFHD